MAGYTDNPSAQLHTGKYTDGDPVAGIPSSRIMAEQTNSLIDEINSVVVAAGDTPDFSQTNQLLVAINKLIALLNATIPISSGTTTTIYGYPQCSDFTVALPTPVNASVYRFIPHATNHATVATTLNGKPLMVYSHETVGATGEVIQARYKALRPGTIAEVLYRQSDDVFIVLNPQESEIIHGSITTSGASGVTTHGWTFTRIATGTYEISTGILRNARLIANCPGADYSVRCTTMGTDGIFLMYVRDSSGALTNVAQTFSLFVVL